MSTPAAVTTFNIRPWVFFIIFLVGHWRITGASAIVGNKVIWKGFETMSVLALRGNLH